MVVNGINKKKSRVIDTCRESPNHIQNIVVTVRNNDREGKQAVAARLMEGYKVLSNISRQNSQQPR